MKSGHDDKRMELTEHLGELRTRILRCIWYLVIGSVLAYQFFEPIYGFMYKPLSNEIKRMNIKRTAETAKQQVRDERPPYDPTDLPKPHNPPTADDLIIRDEAIKWIYTHPPDASPARRRIQRLS